MDQRLHGLPATCSSTDVVAGVVAEHSALPFVPGTHPQARCSTISSGLPAWQACVHSVAQLGCGTQAMAG